jgi:CAAX protease family protein
MTLNTVLGEELLFRGYLLPRMNRTFGRFDWLVRGRHRRRDHARRGQPWSASSSARAPAA